MTVKTEEDVRVLPSAVVALPTPPGTSSLSATKSPHPLRTPIMPSSKPMSSPLANDDEDDEDEDEDDAFFDDDDINSVKSTPNVRPTGRRTAPPSTGTPLEKHPVEDETLMDLPALTLPGAALATLPDDQLVYQPRGSMTPKDQPMFPPPPSRSCTIINTLPSDLSANKNGQGSQRRKRSKKDDMPADAEQRKKARRTSHSDIERRRRLKINEQFEALRQLVPACSQLSTAKRGGDIGLHKLDILQESVAFIKHLTECMTSIEQRLQEQQRLYPGAPITHGLSPYLHPHNTRPPSFSAQMSPHVQSSSHVSPHMHSPYSSQLPSPSLNPTPSSSIPHQLMPLPSPVQPLPHSFNQSGQTTPVLRETVSSLIDSPALSPTDTSKLRISNLVG